MKRRVTTLSIALITLGILCAIPFYSAAASEKLPDTLTWGIRAARGSSYVMDLALLKLWEEKLGIKCFTTQVASSVAAFPKLKRGRLTVWKSGLRDAYLANNGLQEYKGKKYDIRMFYKTIDVHFGFVVLPRSGIKKMEDLAGRTITYTSKRAVTMTECGNALLEFYGIKDKVKNIPNLPMKEKHAALIEGRVDASLEGLPNLDSIWRDAPDAFPLKISKEAAAYVDSKYPWFWGEIAPRDWRMYKGNYVGVGPGLDYPLYTVATPVSTYVYATTSEHLVYTLLKTMYDNFGSLLKVHPFFRDYEVHKIASAKVTVPYHAGTVRYLKEVGVWTPEMEANQKRLLARLGKSK
ncbi:MAG: TAXI family TRAP transporter solute-binding subunit [Deltaproteobacteria bacterium]|nr:TAXI family TRAP transporter solute-binding subunit [Deltaproteobacteria bacterium]